MGVERSQEGKDNLSDKSKKPDVKPKPILPEDTSFDKTQDELLEMEIERMIGEGGENG